MWGVTSDPTPTPSAPAGSATSATKCPARPSRPTRSRTTPPSNPAGARPSPALPPSAPHGITVPVVSARHPVPFPNPGFCGGQNYHSRPPLRRRACAAGVEVREAAALRALRRPRGGESGDGFRVGRGVASGARYRTGGTGTGGV